MCILHTEAEFKEFEPWLKFKTLLKYILVPLKIVFDVSRFKPVFVGFETWLKFIRFELW